MGIIQKIFTDQILKISLFQSFFEELKSLKKKNKSKVFAAGCSREVIQRGADQLGWELEKLLTMTMGAMKATEDTINAECESL